MAYHWGPRRLDPGGAEAMTWWAVGGDIGSSIRVINKDEDVRGDVDEATLQGA